MEATKTVTRWLYLITGVISMLFAGIIYAWSILKAPLAVEFGWNPAELALNFTIMMCFFCGRDSNRYHKKWVSKSHNNRRNPGISRLFIASRIAAPAPRFISELRCGDRSRGRHGL